QFYAADFLVGTSEMSVGEVGLYVRMLALSWDKGALPSEHDRLARMVGVSLREFRALWCAVAEKWTVTEAGYVNGRLEDQRDQRQAFAQVRAAAGRKSGESRRTKREHNANISGTQDEQTPQRKRTLQSSVFDLQTSDQEHTHPARVATNPHSTSTNLVNGSQQRLHGSHAWCSWPVRDGLCVPMFLHREFVGKGGKTDAEMMAWYVGTLERFDGVAVGEDALTFWRREFSAWIGIASTATPSNRSS